jgi:hypothetical protein
MPFAAAARALVVMCAPRLESVVHTRHLVGEVVPALPSRPGGRAVIPVVVSRRRDMAADAADVDEVLSAAGVAVSRAVPIVYDPVTVAAIEAGGNPAGRLARTHLIRSVNALADQLVDRLAGLEPASKGPVQPSAQSWAAARSGVAEGDSRV